ncbi:MAG: helix-turn-helix transcriptional regulator [Mesorhizobium sp.]|nr:MAG: helix-turn-helix transcriptional regulator [Mesorhizobium sp.]TIW10863.1 MAG: helix-turn-helix transcriptional regulator [Mesorhizobium sp.]
MEEKTSRRRWPPCAMTPEQVADRAEISQRYTSSLERGQRNVETLYKIAPALGISHVELVKPDTEATDD